MQHYRFPTRLLDWGENALVALFFAVISNDCTTDGVVYILEPFELNNLTVQEITNKDESFNQIPTVIREFKKKKLFNDDKQLRVDELYRRYLKMDFCNDSSEKEKAYYPLAIMPPPLEKRMEAQAGCFTIFGNKMNGLIGHPQQEKFLKKIVIDKTEKKNILQELERLGINENTIYCDLDALGTYLKRKYREEYFGDTIQILRLSGFCK